jgi:hypothetical protein
MAPSLEIVCRSCGKDTLIRREPVFDGFRKTGERLLCASCGHVYGSETDVPFKAARRSNIFSEADKFRKVDVFSDADKGHTCRHCKHYLVNPFTQRCGMHFKEVQATDSCSDFDAKSPRSGKDD